MGEKTKKKGSISYAKWGYIFIAPFFIIFAVFQLIPLASTIYYSFFEYYRSGLKIIGPNFVGLKNYITLFATDLPKYFSMGYLPDPDRGVVRPLRQRRRLCTGLLHPDRTGKAVHRAAGKAALCMGCPQPGRKQPEHR